MSATLSLRGVTKRFGGLVAVNAMDFDVAEHEVLGLIGPNGSGKSTTLNLISGALPVTSGAIALRGSPITQLPAQDIARRGIARTFQLVRLLPSMNVLENVMAGAVFGHRQRWGYEAEAVAQTMLEKVGLSRWASSPISTPSGWNSPACSRASRAWCCSTNGSPGSIRQRWRWAWR